LFEGTAVSLMKLKVVLVSDLVGCVLLISPISILCWVLICTVVSK
jgi:hypothetical protein